MKRWHVCTALLAIGASARADEPERRWADDSERFQGRWSVSLSTQAGRVEVPYPASYHPEADGLIVAQRLRGHYRIHSALDIGVLLPIASGFVFLPARGEHADSWLLGNPQVFGFHRFDLTHAVEAQLGLSLGLPIGSGSGRPAGELQTNRMLALASGVLGWRHPELFSPRRLTATPSAALRWCDDVFSSGVELRLPFMLATEGEDDDQASINPIGSAAVLSAQGSVSAGGWLFVTARGWVAHSAIWSAEADRFAPSRAQVVVQPELGFTLGRAALLTVNYLIPAGGALSGELQSAGLNVSGMF
jgi:hypothetical protein